MMVSDFHSHILPNVDDGSGSVEESLRMLQLEQKQGVPMVVATPHFYAHRDTMERFLKRREAAADRLWQAMAGTQPLPQVRLGAEVYFFRGISQTDALRELAIQGTECILIEMPQAQWTEKMLQEIARIPERQGLQPIIAHIDRYYQPFRKNTHIRDMLEIPVLIQANAGFFLRSATRSAALRMLKQDRIQLLGSDCHNMDTRMPNLGSAADVIRKKLGEEALCRIQNWEKSVLE